MQGERTRLSIGCVESPIGELRIAATEQGLLKIAFPGGARSDFHAWLARHVPRAERSSDEAWLEDVRAQLGAYFDGRLREFKLSLDLRGTEFQVEVWRRLATIPFGETRTYGELARALGRPGAGRAVGAASGANPLPLVLPCHRVVAARGRLGGFGGGLEAKRHLLGFEQRAVPLLTPG